MAERRTTYRPVPDEKDAYLSGVIHSPRTLTIENFAALTDRVTNTEQRIDGILNSVEVLLQRNAGYVDRVAHLEGRLDSLIASVTMLSQLVEEQRKTIQHIDRNYVNWRSASK